MWHKKCISFLINFYRKYLSVFKLQSCRFEPTCSEYMACAIEKKGLVKGLLLGLYRICRCNPLFRGGYDPV